MTGIEKTDFVDNEQIMDSVYNIVKLSQFEKRLLSTKEMQRLRGIKQLGFVNLVYPDAEHSRFSHSIGVCHQSKELIKHVCSNIKNTERYRIWRRGENKKDEMKGSEITESERIIISAAGLLHDLPHSPFSHEIETVNSNGAGIPVHDNFKENSVFFSYLFNTNDSDLAKIIQLHNETFCQILFADKQWSDIKNNKNIKKGMIAYKYKESEEEKSLPLLGAMIFELLLFDKISCWLKFDDNGSPSLENGNPAVNDEGITVQIGDDKKLQWKRIDNWFRPYRKDIVANTICGDLLDYLLRDGKNTGILPSLDLKFFDRMTIARAIPEKTNTLIPMEKIPDFCEHIVFDIYDHKRGSIRQSVVTEIISFLQQRYLLAERVYNHRVVEGARTMLQEASRLLVSQKVVSINDLHDTNYDYGAPITDEAFISWVHQLNHEEKIELKKAKVLVNMLRERRIFREVVIIDGISGRHKGSYRGPEVNCKTLADCLLDQVHRNEITELLTQQLNDEVKNIYENKNKPDGFPDLKQETLFTFGVRKYGKRYKVPRVLVARPLAKGQTTIEAFPLFDGEELPAIKDRLLSMRIFWGEIAGLPNDRRKKYLFLFQT